MTVKELIEKLQQFPEGALVITEGCDCVGDAHDVVFYKDWWQGETPSTSTDVLITRSE